MKFGRLDRLEVWFEWNGQPFVWPAHLKSGRNSSTLMVDWSLTDAQKATVAAVTGRAKAKHELVQAKSLKPDKSEHEITKAVQFARMLADGTKFPPNTQTYDEVRIAAAESSDWHQEKLIKSNSAVAWAKEGVKDDRWEEGRRKVAGNRPDIELVPMTADYLNTTIAVMKGIVASKPTTLESVKTDLNAIIKNVAESLGKSKGTVSHQVAKTIFGADSFDTHRFSRAAWDAIEKSRAGMDVSGNDILTARKDLPEEFKKNFVSLLSPKPIIVVEDKPNSIASWLGHAVNVVLEGVPGTGKTHAITRLSGKNDGQGKPIPDSGIKAMHTPNGRRLTATGASPFVNVEVRFMTMHPSTSYEDFVEGLRPVGSSRAGFAQWGAPDLFGEAHPLKLGTAPSAAQPPIFVRFKDRDDLVKAKVTIEDSGWFLQAQKPTTGGFAVQDGFFVLACREAAVNPNKAVVVVLDELNRCNIPKVLGDLMTVIEESKRAHWDGSAWVVDSDTKAVTMPYSGRKLFVPDNLFIVGTMNTTDRSVAPMDAALRRRFAFHRIWPQGFSSGGADATETDNLLTRIKSQGGPKYVATIQESHTLWNDINHVLFKRYGADAMLGHSYLDDLSRALAREEAAATAVVEYHWNQRILPQLMDMVVSSGLTRSLVNDPRAFFDRNPKAMAGTGKLATAATVFEGRIRVSFSGTGSQRIAHLTLVKLEPDPPNQQPKNGLEAPNDLAASEVAGGDE
jgi:hypothetical protein